MFLVRIKLCRRILRELGAVFNGMANVHRSSLCTAGKLTYARGVTPKAARPELGKIDPIGSEDCSHDALESINKGEPSNTVFQGPVGQR